MSANRKQFSICIPAYNRARHLAPLLDSIFSQDFVNYEVVLCEDQSPERKQISEIAQTYAERFPGTLFYYENDVNLGYDANIRNLVEKAEGEFCFFMGNDDLMSPGALIKVADILKRHTNVGLVVRSYAWFDRVPEEINQTVRYFTEEREFEPGSEAITICFRRSGVISGYIVHRESAQIAATSDFDGTLYYQMHLTTSVLMTKRAVFTPEVLVLCRNNEPPDFGNSEKERGSYLPGGYTPEARLKMVGGAIRIIEGVDPKTYPGVADNVKRDYANYFYPYIKDQLNLPLRDFIRLYSAYGKMGFRKYPLFHVYCLLGYLLGEVRFDALTARIRRYLGRSPQFGIGK